MRVSEAVNSRRSMRVFKADPVPQSDIEWIISTASRAASNGNLQPWKLELDNRRELLDVGVTGETLKAGDRLVVSGSPARAQPRNLYVRRLERPADGFLYEQIGSSPSIRTLSH